MNKTKGINAILEGSLWVISQCTITELKTNRTEFCKKVLKAFSVENL